MSTNINPIENLTEEQILEQVRLALKESTPEDRREFYLFVLKRSTMSHFKQACSAGYKWLKLSFGLGI